MWPVHPTGAGNDGDYDGIRVSATCALTEAAGAFNAGHDCTITVAGERAARLIF